MAKYSGTLMNLYVALVEDLTADAQGAEGYVPTVDDYLRAGFTKNLDVGGSRASIDLSDKDTGLDTEQVSGRRSGDVSCTLNLDDTGQEGQQIFIDAYNSERGELWWLASQDKVDTLQIWGRANITDDSFSFPEESAAQMNIAMSIIGKRQTGYQEAGTTT